jgi:hypothetical protein
MPCVCRNFVLYLSGTRQNTVGKCRASLSSMTELQLSILSGISGKTKEYLALIGGKRHIRTPPTNVTAQKV